MDYSSKTVLELRKIAKENGVKLGAGLNKAEIIKRLESALGEPQAEQLSLLTEPAVSADPEPAAPEQEAKPTVEAQDIQPAENASPVAPARIPTMPQSQATGTTVAGPSTTQEGAVQRKEQGTPHYRASWHNAAQPAQPKFNGQNRSPWTPPAQGAAPTAPRQAPAPVQGFGPRFGPAATFGPQNGFGPQASPVPTAPKSEPQPAPQQERQEETQPRPSFGPQARTYEQRPFTPNRQQSRPFSGRTGNYNDSPRNEGNVKMPSLQDLITPQDLATASGTFECLADGYGFLRGEQLTPSSRDIYVSSPIVRRAELRNGDFVTGKLRPPRDGDKYGALLYVTDVNGKPPAEGTRVNFDDLTPVYPSRRLSLDDRRFPDARVIDLLCPIGVGSRALMLFPPDCGKRQILLHTAEAIRSQNPDAEVILLLIDFPPEEVTATRDALTCPVIATTFDQTPETQMRLIDLTQERAHRLAESGKDVVLIVDSLTRLVKTYSAAAQQSRQNAGSINPNSLFRAKKLFGAARCAREGGSLTVIATMDIESGVKLDDAIVEEFRSTASTEIFFDAGLARLNVYPPLQYIRSRNRRPELILDSKEQEGMIALRELLASGSPSAAIAQVLGLIDKVTRNRDVLAKIKEWSALMSGARAKS